MILLNYIRKLISGSTVESSKKSGDVEQIEAGLTIYGDGGASFDLSDNMTFENGLPVPDWTALKEWLHELSPETQGKAWADAELGWLAAMRSALGDAYSVSRFQQSVVLSSLDSRQQELVLRYMASSLKRVVRTLGNLANIPEWGHDILIVFDDGDAYYRYVSRYYPEEGEFSLSGGMHIDHGCGHFVTTQQEMKTIEPVIVHEMTHSCLAHLPIPAWLNEGLAVNTEQWLCGSGLIEADTQQRHAQHVNFWNEKTIQQLWSGASFKRADDGSALSYDLSRILVAQLGKDWQQFEAFVLDADLNDGGQAAAIDKFAVTLGSMVCAILEEAYSDAWEPLPEIWDEAPERGAFRLDTRLFAAGRRHWLKC